jgi:cyclophilin family peptidyl-prolyl cis-trans isomerase
MRRWKRVVAVLLAAAVALILEGWAASAQAAPDLFKICTYTRTADGTVRPPYSTASAGPATASPRCLTGKESYRRGVVAMSNNGMNGSAFFFVHTTADLPKTSTIIGAISNGLPVLDRIAATPRHPVRILSVLVG